MLPHRVRSVGLSGAPVPPPIAGLRYPRAPVLKFWMCRRHRASRNRVAPVRRRKRSVGSGLFTGYVIPWWTTVLLLIGGPISGNVPCWSADLSLLHSANLDAQAYLALEGAATLCILGVGGSGGTKISSPQSATSQVRWFLFFFLSFVNMSLDVSLIYLSHINFDTYVQPLFSSWLRHCSYAHISNGT